jgi:hypothetical protein
MAVNHFALPCQISPPRRADHVLQELPIIHPWPGSVLQRFPPTNQSRESSSLCCLPVSATLAACGLSPCIFEAAGCTSCRPASAGVFIRPPLLQSLLRGTSSIRGPQRHCRIRKRAAYVITCPTTNLQPCTVPSPSPAQEPSLNKCPKLPLTNDRHRCLRNTSEPHGCL